MDAKGARALRDRVEGALGRRPGSVFVVFSYGDPMPITACLTPELAEEYAAALGRLPEGHPLRTTEAVVDELPLLSELPAPLLDPEAQRWSEGGV